MILITKKLKLFIFSRIALKKIIKAGKK